MYVCKKNTYIQEEDIKNLLGVCPVEWKIREATLITIADYYPDMDPTTFRLSLLQALEQAREGKAVIKKPNAWLKAAFEKNGAPLITARDIEAQVTRGQGATIKHRAASQADHHLVPAAQPEESEILRRYLAAPEDQRQEIDHQAAEPDRAGQDSRDSDPRSDRGSAGRIGHPSQRPWRRGGRPLREQRAHGQAAPEASEAAPPAFADKTPLRRGHRGSSLPGMQRMG